MAKLSSPTGESQNIGSVQAEALSKTMPDVGDDIKGMLRDLEKGRDVTTETQEQFDKIREHLEKIRDASAEIREDWEGSLEDLKNVRSLADDLLKNQVSERRLSVSLSRQLSAELQRQISLQSTGENITRNSIATRERAVHGLAAQVESAAKALNVGKGIDFTKGGFSEELNAEIDERRLELARKIADEGRRMTADDRAILEIENRKLEALSDQAVIQDAIASSTAKLKGFYRDSNTDIGGMNNRLEVFSRIASRLGLGSLSEEMKTAKSDATAAYFRTRANGGDSKAAIAAYNQIVGDLGSFKGLLGAAVKSISLWTVAFALVKGIWKALISIDEEAVKAKRVTGEWLEGVAIGQTRLVSGQEVLKTIVALSEQFAFNAANVFTPDELARIAEVQKLTGMSAEAAGNLAVQSKINGISTDRYRDSIAAGANQANRLNHSAVTLSAVQNEVLKTSNAIRLSYGQNVEGLARAAGAAKALGMNLQDVENIAKNLMNFESSIESEMQAQLLTGRQLNLAKAREYALNNDLEGVAKEIGKQGITAASFSRMNYIQQEAMAKALGMSREEMSKMLVMQMINKGLSAEQVAAATHMKKEDIEALSVQEKWQTMKQKFLTTLVPLLEPILQIASELLKPVAKLCGWISWLITWGGKAPSSIRFIMGLLVIGVGAFIRHLIRSRGILASMNGLALKLGKSLQLAFTGSWFDRGVGRWRNAAGQFTTAPKLFGGAAGAAANAGTANAAGAGASKLSGAFSKVGKNMNGILKGAAAIAIIATALVIFAYALKLMPKGEEGWQALKMAMLGLLGLAASMIVLGAVVHFAGEFILAGAAAMLLMAGALVVLGAAMLILAKVDWSAFDGVTKAAWQLAAAAPGFVIAGFLLFNAAAPLLIGSTALFLASIPLRGAFKNITAVSGEVLSSVALGIKDIAVAVGELAGKLSNLPVNKMNALGRLLRRAGKSGLVVSTGESAGMTRGTLSDTASVSAVSSVNTQAGEQQSSVSKVDLTEISNKMDRVIRAILSCKPTDWNWVEFHREYISNVPDASRR